MFLRFLPLVLALILIGVRVPRVSNEAEESKNVVEELVLGTPTLRCLIRSFQSEDVVVSMAAGASIDVGSVQLSDKSMMWLIFSSLHTVFSTPHT